MPALVAGIHAFCCWASTRKSGWPGQALRLTAHRKRLRGLTNVPIPENRLSMLA